MFAGVDGYGHGDVGRETLDKVYARLFGAEAALVSDAIASPFCVAVVVVLRLVSSAGIVTDNLFLARITPVNYGGQSRIGQSRMVVTARVTANASSWFHRTVLSLACQEHASTRCSDRVQPQRNAMIVLVPCVGRPPRWSCG